MSSLPPLGDSSRGRGISELKGNDPMDRRIEVEKKERYGRALREQMAMNASSRAAGFGAAGGGGHASSRGATPEPPEREPLMHAAAPPHGSHSTPSLHTAGLHVSSSGLPPNLPIAPDTPSSAAMRGFTPLSSHDHSAMTADKVAQVQDLMRQRLKEVQEEQQRQWHFMQTALQTQLTGAREAAELAVQKRLEEMREGHAAELQRALGESAAAARQAEGLAAELAALRREVERLGAQGRAHEETLEVHTVEIERLKQGHEECARERRALASSFEQFRAELRETRQHQEDLARRVHDIPAMLQRLRDEVLRLASQAARDIFEKYKPRPASPPPAPPPPPPQPEFPPEVSKEAFALLRDTDGNLFEFPALQNTVGRGAQCNVCISTSQAVSNRHASMVIDREGKSSIQDLGSRNGTFLNDRRVPQDSGFVVESGDSIKLGIDGPTFLFEFGPAYYARWPYNPERLRPGQVGPSSSKRALSRGR